MSTPSEKANCHSSLQRLTKNNNNNSCNSVTRKPCHFFFCTKTQFLNYHMNVSARCMCSLHSSTCEYVWRNVVTHINLPRPMLHWLNGCAPLQNVHTYFPQTAIASDSLGGVCSLRMRRNRTRKFCILLFRSPKFAVTSCMHSLCRAARVIRIFPCDFFIFSRRSSLCRVYDERLWVLHPLAPSTSQPLHVMYATDWFSFFYVVNKSKFTFLIRIVMLLLLSWRCVPHNQDIGLRNWV